MVAWWDRLKKEVDKEVRNMDNNLTDAIGDGDYLPRTDESDIDKPKDDGKKS